MQVGFDIKARITYHVVITTPSFGECYWWQGYPYQRLECLNEPTWMMMPLIQIMPWLYFLPYSQLSEQGGRVFSLSIDSGWYIWFIWLIDCLILPGHLAALRIYIRPTMTTSLYFTWLHLRLHGVFDIGIFYQYILRHLGDMRRVSFNDNLKT